MPEGDTIYRLARRLDQALAGQHIRAALSPRLPHLSSLAGGRVQAVASVGKHVVLIVLLDGGGEQLLRVHLGMDGRWRLRRRLPGRPAELPHRLTLALSTEALTVVAWDCKELELGSPEVLWAADGSLGRLGPDVLSEDFLPAAVVPRARASGHSLVGELLLDQRVAAGIGNIYKDESLFLAGVNPWTPPDALSDAALVELYAGARALMGANLGGRQRVTTRAPGLLGLPFAPTWVYGRAGRGCLRCGVPICLAHLGRYQRVTCWCPRCQARLGGGGTALEPSGVVELPPLLDEIEPVE